MSENSWKIIAETMTAINNAKEKFRIIMDNPALHGAEYGLTNQEQEILEKLIENCGTATFVADKIARKVLGNTETQR